MVSRQAFHTSAVSRCTFYPGRCARTILQKSVHSPTFCTSSKRGKTAMNYTGTMELCQYFHSGIHYLASTSHLHANNKGSCSRLILLAPRETKCIHHRALTRSSHSIAEGLVTGTWNVFTIDGATHASIVPHWTGSELQITFFEGLGERLQLMEDRWAAGRAA